MNETSSLQKILIVDDKPQNLYTLKQVLTPLNVEVIQTTSGAEALIRRFFAHVGRSDLS
jgi:CheY-like chemotaxis protein